MPKKGTPTYQKNEYKLELLLTTRPDQFLKPIMELRRGFGHNTFFRFLYVLQGKEFDQKKQLILQRKLKFIEEYPKQTIVNLNKKIKEIILNNHLGDEWISPILDAIVGGYIYPPSYNLDIFDNASTKELSVKLNASTSLEDIREAWPEIRKKQRTIFGKIKQTYFGKKTGRNLLIALKDMRERRLNNEVVDNVSWEKYKLTDSDRAENILGDGTTRKVNFLRQNRKRIKEKI